MIHPTLSKAQIAFEYYQKTAKGKYETEEQARKQFSQDRKIKISVVEGIVKDIFNEQMTMLKQEKARLIRLKKQERISYLKNVDDYIKNI